MAEQKAVCGPVPDPASGDGASRPGAGRRAPGLRRALIAAVALVALVIALTEIYRLSAERGSAHLAATGRATAQARASGLASEVAHQRAVVAILAGDRDVIEALSAPTETRGQALSEKLERLRDAAGGSVLYIVSDDGTALAASNWNEPDSFRGSNYRFRSYFSDAMQSGAGVEYALGSVSRRPGLYLSQRVGPEGAALGAVIDKVDFAETEAAWQRSGGHTVVVDASGRVTLTSEPGLRFGPLPALDEGRLRLVEPVAGTPWTLVMTLSLAEVRRQAMMNTVMAGLGLLPLLSGLGYFLRRRRRALARARAELTYRQDLEREVAARTRELSGEIRERVDAEKRLAEMQGRLVQANRLATLGQVTAGVAHEVNQPLATIRLLAENGQAMLAAPDPAPALPEVAGNLDQIVRMCERIQTITSELRGFSRKAGGGHEAVSFAEAWEASLLLSASRRAADRVRLIAPDIPPGLRVMAEKVRLEQVLVNLLQNAHEALHDRPDPEIRVTLSRSTDAAGARWITCTVADNGPGLAPEVAGNLFSPFLTTKAQGLGLGLVISQGIMRDFGGRLRADPPGPGRGARFHIDLREAD
ncbi:sensor histidine kinase [Paenirhodobacter enshiensis]|uniref:sensor histidine kinase n=1 Tax=Paenirhodobacter enshiensis TaxID=1105367 RepID=UPI0035ADC66C